MPAPRAHPEGAMTMGSRTRAHGGKGGKEPRRRVRLREVQVLDRYVTGQSQDQIASALGVSQPAVSKILRRLEDRQLADLGVKRDRQRAQHTMHLRFLYAQAIGAWQASQEDGERRRQRQTTGGASGGAQTVAELVSENRHGDPRFLESARKILADVRALWGVDAPERVAVEGRLAGALADGELDAELVRQIGLVQRLLAPEPPVSVAVHHEKEKTDDRTK